MTVYCCVDREVDFCLQFLLISGTGARTVDHTAVPFDTCDKDRRVFMFLRSKLMAAAALFHGVVCDVGGDGPVGI